MERDTILQDVNMYKTFLVAQKYGIMTWDKRLIFPPKCITPPDVEALETTGYTFIQLEDGYNIIDRKGQVFLEEAVEDIAWLVPKEIVGFVAKDGTENMFFIKNRKVIRKITDAELQQKFIQTFRGKKTGITTYSGIEVFEPKFSAVAIFDEGIYIGYNSDGSSVLNSISWEAPTRKAESFENMTSGIMAKFSAGKYGWINPKTGKTLKPEEQTKQQQKLLEFAKKKEELL